MPLAICNISNEALWLTKFFANKPYNIDVLHFVMSTNIVYLTHTTIMNNMVNSLAVVFYIQPVTNIFAFSINRQRLVIQSICNH
ncbi:hypothetical protein SDC9_164881 [bioreactor metagenome]|uniref:Uncharacterized protein n=1 Tax=bioreactor metagenome TaxID=1076179 RepID=A0A645FSU9_9ZZZZ